MCGIGGKVSFSTKPDASLAEEMNASMVHRGPDSRGVYANGPAILAHRRLSVLDTSNAGRQPMSNVDGTVHIVYNGEIYNYQELREYLDRYTFSSDTDTEVLLHLYEEQGIDCLKNLRGMFAFGIWDESQERLFLARDRLGQKPLFYRYHDGDFWFGSTIRAILSDDAVTPTPDLAAIRRYLTYQYVPHPATGFETIAQLEPAEYMVVGEEGIRKNRYWSLSYADQFDAPPSRLSGELRTKLTEVTRLRMRSDVPIGVFLSGGIDSSIVTALMAEIADHPVETYAIGFGSDSYDELEYAQEVASMYDTNHHEYTVTSDLTAMLPDIVEEYEMPFGDPSALPTHYVSKVASDDLTVVLGGDGGDENFAGYDRYSWDRIAYWLSRIPPDIRDAGTRTLALLEPLLGRRSYFARRGLELADSDGVRRYANFVCNAVGEEVSSLWDGPIPDDELEQIRGAFIRTDGPTRLDRLMHVDVQTYLPDDLLVKIDRAGMAFSLEVRSPFLDHELMEFSARIPARWKRRHGTKKWLLKRAFRDDLPHEVLTRGKQGFGIPVNEWFRDELVTYARERITQLGDRDPFDATKLEVVLDGHTSGIRRNGRRIWNLVMLEEWYQRFIDGYR